MQEQAKLALSSKGKAREDAHWQPGWWDFAHALDGTRRPLVWSKSSIIYTAHPSEPSVLARHFPSSRHFVLPSAPQIAASPANYEPPTVISISTNEDMLFAYFPGRGGNGAGCVWKRGIQLDNWQVRECWSFEQGAGAVTAAWTTTQREWTITESGSSARLPPRGPLTPLFSTILLLVTEDHCLSLCVLPPVAASLKVVKTSLLQAGVAQEAQSKDDSLPKTVGPNLCVAAAIYMGYNEPSLLIAMRSKILPPQRIHESTYTAMNLNMPLDINDVGPSYEVPLTPEWDLWGEDSMINLCEVRMSMKLVMKGVLARPLPPIPCPSHHLTDLQFISVPPSNEPHKAYLAASFLNFGDYTAAPKSELLLFSFTKRDAQPMNLYTPGWIPHHEARRVYDGKVLDFVLPSPSRDSLLVGLMNLGGSVPHLKRKTKGGSIGSMHILKLSDLSEDDAWDVAPIMSDMARTGRAVPANIALSPNRALLCSVAASTFLDSHIAIHALPRRRHDGGRPPTNSLLVDLPSLLITAIRSRSSPADVIHPLTSPAVPVQTAIDVLCEVLLYFNEEAPSLREVWTAEVLNVAGEVYLTKSRHAEGEEKEDLLARWKTIHDICSLSACSSAFALCGEGQIYDLSDIWHLVCFSTWFVEFLEGVLREAVLAGDESSLGMTGAQPRSASSTSTFVHLVHPYSLGRIRMILDHVKRFRKHIASLTAKGENAQIARDVLLDVIDCSGIDLDQISVVLGDVYESLRGANENDLRQTLLGGTPRPSLSNALRSAVEKIAGTGGINRARLFIKPGDLVDGVARLSLVDQHLKDKQRDVVSKGLLLHPAMGTVYPWAVLSIGVLGRGSGNSVVYVVALGGSYYTIPDFASGASLRFAVRGRSKGKLALPFLSS
ncbi:hypothetical protein DAEQUDRAFT_810869 [Daedalea quercina L-15889]|uniref:Mediator complex subunit 16 n=1 Tax=Daedalea quercina L-15889 TaxID=1314783 RepID=A0A165R0B3_9APHY|nr:hypothetical protein DAEQUDRAFT_810869 [Daedalea quercina L-15889]